VARFYDELRHGKSPAAALTDAQRHVRYATMRALLCHVGRCCVDRSGGSLTGRGVGDSLSEAGCKVSERGADSIVDGQVGGELAMPAAKVLHERVTGRDGAQ
jgi:hypothetical protein